MTTPYDATGRNCIECGEEVEDYTGHLQASEVTICEECDSEDVQDKWSYRAQVIHTVPRKA